MRKTILYFGNTLYPDKDASAHRTLGNAKALRELGYNVVLIGCRKDETRSILNTKEIYDGFAIYYYPEPISFKQWYAYITDFYPLRKVIDEMTVYAVILYNHPSISSKCIWKYCKARDIKVYADCTEWYDPHGYSIHALIKRIDTWYRMRHINKKLDGIISISSYIQNYYQNYNCQTICVPPLIDKKSHKWDNSFMIEDNPITQLVYVGNPGAGTKDKLGVIIEAMKRLEKDDPTFNIRFDILGMTESQFENAFKMKVDNCSFVSFHGRKPNSEALDFIKKSDFTIFLRDNNLVCTAGFPTKFSESIACGTPVLTNLSSDLGKYLKEGENGFILDSTNMNTLCETLRNALSIPKEHLNKMKNFCLKETTFDYHSFVEEFKKMF